MRQAAAGLNRRITSGMHSSSWDPGRTAWFGGLGVLDPRLAVHAPGASFDVQTPSALNQVSCPRPSAASCSDLLYRAALLGKSFASASVHPGAWCSNTQAGSHAST